MNYRHGDLCLFGAEKLPNGLKISKSKVLMVGSNQNNHSYDNGKFYPVKKDNFIIGYFHAENTTLYHLEHGKKVKCKNLREAKLKDGMYELRKQQENTHDGMKAVID